eukprot:TRINITY_DN71_c0_g1_i1.p1 TRINITY_DN71_c0_g1~~TRINITY_DN71_c0_g1_i1.p1  ORF type:complete len:242 (-),score=42.87 TRINITY_DN71_c0_g1_i1:21-746(-)
MGDTYLSHENKSDAVAAAYHHTKEVALRYIAFRDVPDLFSKHLKGKTALDFGCGTGLSTQFLLKQGLSVTGVDISQEMLKQASADCSSVEFKVVEGGKIPIGDSSVDLVFSSFVFFEIANSSEGIAYLNEANRVLKDDGIVMLIVASEDVTTRDWSSVKNDFPDNVGKKAGEKARFLIPELQLEFVDYLWDNKDYVHCLNASGFEILETHGPLGKENEGYVWKSEKEHPIFLIYVARKARK